MAISWVQQGYIQVAGELTYNPDSFDGVKLESPRGLAWLESISSFRFEPAGDGKPYTVRKEASGYWYGYRKVSGKLHKKYIGKSSEISMAKLEEIAEALNIPPQPRVTDKVTQVTQISDSLVTDKVTDTRNADRLTTLELQVQALQESLEALREELRGKSELGDSEELPKVDNEVAEELQNDLGNLKAENETLKADYAQLLESSTVVANKLREEVQRLRSQLETERSSQKEVETELARLADDREELTQLEKWAKEAAAEVHREGNAIKVERIRWQRELSDARAELADAKATILNQSNKIRELERGFSLKPNPAESRLRLEIGELQTELADLKQKSAPARKDFPDAADVLNQLKTRRKKSKADLADLETILEILES